MKLRVSFPKVGFGHLDDGSGEMPFFNRFLALDHSPKRLNLDHGSSELQEVLPGQPTPNMGLDENDVTLYHSMQLVAQSVEGGVTEKDLG